MSDYIDRLRNQNASLSSRLMTSETDRMKLLRIIVGSVRDDLDDMEKALLRRCCDAVAAVLADATMPTQDEADQ